MNDKSFNTLNKENDLIDSQIKELEKKIIKQDSLLKQSKELQKGFTKKNSSLNIENYKLKIKLLESLGVE